MARPEIKPEERKTTSSIRLNIKQREILNCIDTSLQRSIEELIELYYENSDIFDNLIEMKGCK